MAETGNPSILTSALPFGATPPQELDHWPKMRLWVSRRFGAIRLRAMAANTDPEARRLLELCGELGSRDPAWRARFFDDLETCSWVQAFSEGEWRGKTPPNERLEYLIDREPSAYTSIGSADVRWPRVIVAKSPSRFGDVFPNRKLDAPLPLAPVEQRRLFDRRFAATLSQLENSWRAMSEIVVHHIKAVAILTDRKSEISSNKYYPGVLFLGEDRVGDISCEHVVHEAIHQSLFCLEGEGAFQPKQIGKKFVSMWSGNEIPSSVYFHLPVVYFGLFMLYEKLGQTGSACQSDERLRQIGAGLREFFAEQTRRNWLSPRGELVFQELRRLMDAHRFFSACDGPRRTLREPTASER